jgi:hypothetical protein
MGASNKGGAIKAVPLTNLLPQRHLSLEALCPNNESKVAMILSVRPTFNNTTTREPSNEYRHECVIHYGIYYKVSILSMASLDPLQAAIARL